MWFWVVLIVVPIVLAALFWLIIKSVWKAISLAFLIMIVALSVLGFLIIKDSRDFSQKMQGSDNAFYLEDNGRLLAGAVNLIDPQRIKVISEEEFSAYRSPAAEQDYHALLGGNFKLFIFRMRAFDALTEDDFKDQELFKKPLIYSILDSNDSVGVFIDESIRRQLGDQQISPEQMEMVRADLRKKMPSEQQTRATMFAMLFGTLVQKYGPVVILDEYRKGNLKIYPETIMFKTIMYVPEPAFQYAKQAQAMQMKVG